MAAGQIRGEDGGTGPAVATGDRCRGFEKGQGFPLQNLFKQTNREPEPRRETKLQGHQRGPWLEGWGKSEVGAAGFGGRGEKVRAKGKEAGEFPGCFHRLSQALLISGSIRSLRIALSN